MTVYRFYSNNMSMFFDKQRFTQTPCSLNDSCGFL